eukprot:SAG11_NODE_167_length_13647_cov_7.705049_18_plen_213_part_00
MADVIDLTGEPDVIDLTDEPEVKRQDLSKDHLGDDLLDLVYKQLPLREKMRAARVSKGFNRVAKNNMLGEAEGKLKHIVNYYQKRIARPHLSADGNTLRNEMGGANLPPRHPHTRYAIHDIVKEIRRPSLYDGHDLAGQAHRAINKGVIDQIGKLIDIGRGIIPDPRGPMFDDTVPHRIISETNRPLKFKRGDLPPAEIKRIMDARHPTQVD